MADRTKIDWADASVNPWWGCSGTCDYCYGRSLARRFGRTATERAYIPSWRDHSWRKAIQKANDRVKRTGISQVVFLESMGDFFDVQVPDSWRWGVLGYLDRFPDLDIVVLTKQPDNISFRLGRKFWVGISVDWKDPDVTWGRIQTFLNLAHEYVPPDRRVLSIEPFLGYVPTNRLYVLKFFAWVIVGGLSGGPPPPKDWVDDIDTVTRGSGKPLDKTYLDGDWGIPLFVKKNAGGGRQEYPPLMKRKVR